MIPSGCAESRQVSLEFALAKSAWRTPPPARIVALGGGTGLPAVLLGLRRIMFPSSRPWSPETDRDRLTAIVTVADDGGSSGRLRRAFGVLPPGDLRNCLLALAEGDPVLASLFAFRFDGQGEVGGHNLGNLIMTALSMMEHDLLRAVEEASRLLSVRGRVLPSTCDSITLNADLDDGSRVEGESRIALARRRIRRIRIEPEDARALPLALKAIAAADLVVIGPGSLYTSIMPVLLIPGLADALSRCHATIALVANLMTEPGETDGYSAADILLAIRHHAPSVPVHKVLLNSAAIPRALIDRYAAHGALPIGTETEPFKFLGCRPVERDLLEVDNRIRHDPAKLGRAVLEIVREETECATPA